MGMKKLGILSGLITIFTALVITGCGAKNVERETTISEKTNTETEETESISTETVTIDTEGTEAETETEDELDAEKQKFSDWASSDKIYGFLLSEYDAPADADFGEVFDWGYATPTTSVNLDNNTITEYDYDDNKIATMDLSDPVVINYYKEHGWGGDKFIYYKDDVDAVLTEVIGLTSDEVNYDFDWIETARGTAVLMEVSDCNKQAYNCIDIEKNGDIYTLVFVPPSNTYDEFVVSDRNYENEDNTGIPVTKITTVVKDCGDERYQILSNHFN